MSLPVVETPHAAPEEVRSSAVLRWFPSLGVPPYRLFWLGMLPMTLAWQMTLVATGYAAFTIAGNATALGIVTFAMGPPLVAFALAGGVLADRVARRTILAIGPLVLAVTTIVPALLALAGVLAVWHLAASQFAQGVMVAFWSPARQAYVADLVGPKLLGNAVAVNNAGLNFARIAGPALAGALLGVPGMNVGTVFVIISIMIVAPLPCFLFLPRGMPPALDGSSAPRGAGWDQGVEGLRYIRSSPVLLVLLALAILPLFFGMPYQALMPLFAERVFAVGATGLGMLMAATGIGALAGSLAIAAFSDVRQRALLQTLLGVGFGVTLVGFALSPTFELAVLVLVLVGASSAAYTVLNTTLIMASSEPQYYGRVMSIYMLSFGVTPFSALPMAWLADYLGGRATIAGAGLVVVAIVLAFAVLFPSYRRVR